jgi:DNA-binding HxlR family transcriptional regulator
MVGSTRFGQFLDSGEAIATNILADRLARLERGGIVTKQRDSEHGARYIYELTDKGLDLVPLLIEIARWSVKHNADVTMPPGLLGRIEQEPEAVVTELVDALKKARRARAKLVVNKSL